MWGSRERSFFFSHSPPFFLLFFFFFLSLSFSLPGWEKVQTVYRLMRTILYRRENGRCSWIVRCWVTENKLIEMTRLSFDSSSPPQAFIHSFICQIFIEGSQGAKDRARCWVKNDEGGENPARMIDHS